MVSMWVVYVTPVAGDPHHERRRRNLLRSRLLSASAFGVPALGGEDPRLTSEI